MKYLLVLIAAVLLLQGCQGGGQSRFDSLLEGVDASGKPLPGKNRGNSRTLFGSGNSQPATDVVSEGSGTFVSSRAPAIATETRANGQAGYRLNLADAPIAAAAKNVLGDTLGLTYSIDSNVRGNITLQTSGAVNRETLIEVFETALAANGASLVRSGAGYQIVPIGSALASTPSISVPSVSSNSPGLKIQVIELNYISAAEMQNILSPISREGSILRADDARNYIMIAGTNSDLAAMREAISVFDVDWMRGMSVALHPLKTSQPGEVAKELETIFGVTDGPGAKVIRFVPNERLKSVLVITSRPQYLARAARWIDKLDRIANSNEEQLFVYNIQNRPAKEMAAVLQSVLSGKSDGGENSVSPDLSAVEVSEEGVSEQPPGGSIATASGTAVSVVADEENNALLISTTAREYRRIEQILVQLDVLPTQVFLEAVIAEVSLNDELKFGVRWFFEHGGFSLRLSDLASGFTGATFPGLGWSFATNDFQVTLNALSSVTDVKVISSPNLVALNNQQAILQIGDQVPIVTQTSTGTTAPGAPVISTVELKDTGIILTMTPRVNTSGRILLDIEQEVSNVVRTTTSGIDSPTIQQRKVATRVVVNDGEAIALGGLIQERETATRGQVPILGEVPVFGNLFRNKTSRTERTELIIFIRPRIIRNVAEARAVTDEFRRKLDFHQPSFQEKAAKELKRLQ
ncbi:MAG: type II secretion system secretin GspD [Nitratireductor sp.]|nr:type II secretion system secretin GspD [Nitratireductor sp.]